MLHHELLGEGQLVILIHSGGMSGRQWRKLALQLSTTHRVAVPDLIGSGKNPPWPDAAAFEYALDVTAIGELIDSLGGRAHIVGHSYGGLLALSFARQRPNAVLSLAVYDPVAFGVLHAADDAPGLADLGRANQAPVFLDDARGGSEPWLEAFVDYWNGPGSWRGLPAAAKESFLRVGRKVYLEVRSLLADRTPAGAYASITAPTLLLGGERSPVSVQRVLALLSAALPEARMQTVDGAGHMGPISHAAEVNALLVEHIIRSGSS